MMTITRLPEASHWVVLFGAPQRVPATAFFPPHVHYPTIGIGPENKRYFDSREELVSRLDQLGLHVTDNNAVTCIYPD